MGSLCHNNQQAECWYPHDGNTYWPPDSKVHGAHMGPTWGLQDPGGPHVGHVILAIWALCGGLIIGQLCGTLIFLLMLARISCWTNIRVADDWHTMALMRRYSNDKRHVWFSKFVQLWKISDIFSLIRLYKWLFTWVLTRTRRGDSFKNNYEFLYLRTLPLLPLNKNTSFDVWTGYFMWKFKGYLWNPHQNTYNDRKFFIQSKHVKRP